MSRLTDLLRRVRELDTQLATDLDGEFQVLADRRAFGLNFERHQPEAVELPGRPVRKGDKVRVLPPRGSTKTGDPRLWLVEKLAGPADDRKARLVSLGGAEADTADVDVADLVVVAEFRDPIYPGLVSTGKVERGRDKPFHAVINAENFHALQTLLFTHRGAVDCIYIDPPYNTGAKDWKYNNDYVEGDDLYRHSKWLAFMERRLLLAKELLIPQSGVLIVTIDENEGSRLHLLLEQVFPDYEITGVHIAHNPRGVQGDNFSFTHETAIFVVPRGRKIIAPRVLSDEEVIENTSNLRNWGGESERHDAANCFYPIYVNDDGIVGFGDDVTQDLTVHPAHNEPQADGTVAVWPVDQNGIERKWRYARQSVDEIRSQLVVKRINRGQLRGDFEVQIAKSTGKQKTIWQGARFDASTHGTQLVKSLTERSFPFPKSLYAVEDAVDAVVRSRPEAIVVDFFSGSGTTAHAVMRLNRRDGGSRQSISITNNEVAADDQKALRGQGFRPGDPEWETHGICDFITKPRIEAAVTGLTPAGEPIAGEYKFTDVFPMSDGFEENVEFFTMTYNSPRVVSHNRAFASIAPLLWMRAGMRGDRIDSIPDAQGWAVAQAYGVIAELDNARAFLAAMAENPDVVVAFIVTDDDRRFQMVCAGLPQTVQPVRLYESYLSSFEFDAGVLS